MSTIRITPPTWSAGAVGTGLNQESDAPFSNLLHELPSHAWKSTNLTTVRGYFNALSVKKFDTIAIMYTNATASATYSIRATNTLANLWTSPTLHVPGLPFRMSPNLDSWTYWHTIAYFVSMQEYQYIGLEFSDPTNPDGYFRAGVCVIGETYVPLIGYNPATSGWDRWIDTSVETRLRSSERTFRHEPRKKHGKFEIPNQTNTHAKVWDDLSRIYGNSYPVIVKTKEMDNSTLFHQHTIGYVTMNITIQEITRVPPGYSNVTLEVEEI